MTELVRPICLEEFATHIMSFDFAKAAWLQYSEKEKNYFGIPSLDAQEALLK